MDRELEELAEFRAMGPGDMPLVLDSWGKGWRASPWSGVVPNNAWHGVFVDSAAQLLARGAVVEVAGVTGKPDAVLGYAVSERVRDGLAIHYVYVKDPYRRRGLGAELVRRAEERHHGEEAPKRRFYTHRTRDAHRVCPPASWTHAPEIARRRVG